MKVLYFIMLSFISLSIHSQSDVNLKNDSIRLSKTTLYIRVLSFGKKNFPKDIAIALKDKDKILFNKVKKASTSLSIYIDSTEYYAPLLDDSCTLEDLLRCINNIVEAQLLKIEYYINGVKKIYYILVDFKC